MSRVAKNVSARGRTIIQRLSNVVLARVRERAAARRAAVAGAKRVEHRAARKVRRTEPGELAELLGRVREADTVVAEVVRQLLLPHRFSILQRREPLVAQVYRFGREHHPILLQMTQAQEH